MAGARIAAMAPLRPARTVPAELRSIQLNFDALPHGQVGPGATARRRPQRTSGRHFPDEGRRHSGHGVASLAMGGNARAPEPGPV